MKITVEQYQIAADKIGCEVAAIKAVSEVESNGAGFNSDGIPKTLFEGHIFHKLTEGKYSQKYPTISYPKWTKKYYGNQKNEKLRLELAVKLDRDYALQSCSWGAFQIMGFNYGRCGFGSIQSFVNAMYKNEFEHLIAFVNYIKFMKMEKHIINKDWTTFARLYNGPGYAKNNYHIKMKEAYEKYSK